MQQYLPCLVSLATTVIGYGDSAYASQKALIHGKAPKARDFTNQRTRRAGEVAEVARGKNRNKSKIRESVTGRFCRRITRCAAPMLALKPLKSLVEAPQPR